MGVYSEKEVKYLLPRASKFEGSGTGVARTDANRREKSA